MALKVMGSDSPNTPSMSRNRFANSVSAANNWMKGKKKCGESTRVRVVRVRVRVCARLSKRVYGCPRMRACVRIRLDTLPCDIKRWPIDSTDLCYEERYYYH